MNELCPIRQRALQEYLEALAFHDDTPVKRARRLLFSYAEFQFKMRGGSRCAVCHATVRHVVPVRIERVDGTRAAFTCLCTRCLEAERPMAHSIVMQIGQARLEHRNGKRPPMMRARAS